MSGHERTATDRQQSRASSAVPLRLIVLGDLEGVVEPCGCGSRPAGGLDRVVAAVDQLRRGRQPTLVVGAGDLLFSSGSSAKRRPRVQDEWKADAVSAVLPRLGIDAIAVGPADLLWGAVRLQELARSAAAQLVTVGIVSPRIESLADGVLLGEGRARVGLTAAIRAPPDASERLRPAVDSLAALRDASTRLRERGAGLVIAAIHGGEQPTAQLAAQADVDIMVHTGVNDPAPGVTVFAERALLVSPGRHGEALVSIDLWPAGRPSRSWRLLQAPPPAPQAATHAAVATYVSLDAGTPRDAAARARLERLFARINAHNAEVEAVQADISAASTGGVPYVGSETCAACHTQAYFWWRRTAHGQAFDTLVSRGRQYDLDCVGCHATGDEALGSSLRAIEQRKGVGCESCHGPGGAHAENPRPPHRGLRREVAAQRCLACHDHDHSAGFRYAAHRLQLLVAGHGGDQRDP